MSLRETKQKSDLTIKPKRWSHQVTEWVDGAIWRCEVCGWLGDNLYSVDHAQREGLRHFAEDHPEIRTVDVSLEQQLLVGIKSVGVEENQG